MSFFGARKLTVSIAIVALMLSATLLVQTSSATTVSTMQKSIALTAGADGRAFAVIDGRYQYPSTQRVDYNYPFNLYAIAYANTYSTINYAGIGPKFEYPQSDFNPSSLSTGFLSPNSEISKFMMMRNTTLNVVSPTINLTVRAVTLGLGGTAEFQADTSNYVLATLGVSAGDQNKLMALTGLLTGSGVDISLYYPNGAYYRTWSTAAGYFAFPFLANMAGNYAFYFTSAGASNLQIKPTELGVTSLSMGSYDIGEIKMPTEIDLTALAALDPAPSQIKAVSCSVSAGEAFTFWFSMIEHLTGLGPSDVECWYFDSLKWGNGLPVAGELVSGSSTRPSSIAGASGKAYIVLVANVPTRITYSMGLTSLAIPTAPLNTPFSVDLPVAGLAPTQQYKFTLAQDSMVRFNRTAVTGTTMSAHLARITTDGTFYNTYLPNIAAGGSWVRLGNAETAYDYAKYLPAGTYWLNFTSTGTSNVQVEINAYPIAEYTSGSAFDLTVHTTKALAINVTNAFRNYAFNITFLSQLNASMFYRITLYDDWNRYLNTYVTTGTSSGVAGIGNKKQGGSWIDLTGQYYIDPDGTGQRYFSGNQSLLRCGFMASYAGTYLLVVDFLNGYNTTTQGNSNLNRWRFYKDLVVSLKMTLSERSAASLGYADVKSVTIDSSSGTGSNSVTLTEDGVNLIYLVLSPKNRTWSRIAVSILNGTRFDYADIYDKIRYSGYDTFDRDAALGLWPPYSQVTNIYGYQNATWRIEFGALLSPMMIAFTIAVPAVAAHTVVTFSVGHYNTTAISGLSGPSISVAGAFPWEVVLIVGVIVVAALVVVAVVLKKKKHGSS